METTKELNKEFEQRLNIKRLGRKEKEKRYSEYKELNLKFGKYCRDTGVYDYDDLIVWFRLAFPECFDLNHFSQWVERYSQGAFYFISRMDNERKQIFFNMFKR